MKLKQSQNLKTKLSPTLKSWFPILQSSTMDLEEVLGDFVQENPFVDIQSNIQENLPTMRYTKPIKQHLDKKYISDKIEALSVYEKSLYECLEAQITPPLFPTPISQKIALNIIDDINDEGYFEGDIEEIAKYCGVESSLVERTRLRFAKIDPPGIGAKSPLESMIFQLEDCDVCDELYDLIFQILHNLESHIKDLQSKSLNALDELDLLKGLDVEHCALYKKNPLYNNAMNIIRRFKIPPALDYFPKVTQIIPDLFINHTNEGFEVNLNDTYYPDIFINNKAQDSTYTKDKVKEARDLIDALSMRKSTIKKIGLMILEYQYDFFVGGEMKPLKLKDIALELGYSASTISRAVANKYLECNRGIFQLKSFFTTAITEDTSSASIKDFILECIKAENREKPLSDICLLTLIEKKFSVKMVRRTITKYRKQLNIASSSKRKRLYRLQ